MKKYAIIAAFLFAVCMAGFSQTGIYSGGLWKTALREKGLIVRPEIGYENNIVIYGNMGSQITHQFYAGGGLGVTFASGYDYYGGQKITPIVSLYGSGRAYLSPRKSAAFIEMKVGLTIKTNSNTTNNSAVHPVSVTISTISTSRLVRRISTV